jgi:hypothetical protein
MNDKEFDELLKLSTNWLPLGSDTDLNTYWMVVEFMIVYQLFLLHRIFMLLTWNHLMKIFEFANSVSPPGSTDLINAQHIQIRVLQDIQQLLMQLTPDT